METKPVGLESTNESTLLPNVLTHRTAWCWRDRKSSKKEKKDVLTPGPRLTPTGKISHAKTRVYTQRYRKEWEQMPDFKGWLTSVPYQPTRAYCTFCKKNLHAHRLSLLKHTCTMKHQRAALMHEVEEKKGMLKTDPGLDGEDADDVEPQANMHVKYEAEENDDEIEYVVERLEMDDDEEEDSHLKEQLQHVSGDAEDEEEANEDDDMASQDPSEEEENVKPRKKIKLDVETCRDTLAEAMAHMHGEYFEECEDHGNVQMEMVVESEDQSNTNTPVMTVLSETKDVDKSSSKESQDNGRSVRPKDRSDNVSAVKVKEDSKAQTDSEIVVACNLPILGTAYQINSPVVPTSGTIGLLQPINTLPIAPAQNKTITLKTGGRTLTLTGDTFQPGGQYILSKLKGNKFPTLVMAGKKPGTVVKLSQDQLVVASTSTSRQSSNKPVLLKAVKSASKRPRISTHIVDTSKGVPVGGLQVSLYKLMDGLWTFLTESTTGSNGRCPDLVHNMKVNFTAGRYKIHFDVDKYFSLRRIETMYPFIEIVFDVKNPVGHHHIPLLLSPFGYTTYRGSER